MATDSDHTFDVIVIGLGPGGEHVAGSLAERGLRVLGVDRRLVGGVCPYWGCIPSKMMIRAGDALAEARRVDGLAGSVGQVTPDWSVVARRIREEATDNWDDQVAVDRLTGKGRRSCAERAASPGRGESMSTAPPTRDQGHRRQHRHDACRAADRGPARHALLDQPRGHRDHGPARLAHRARRGAPSAVS